MFSFSVLVHAQIDFGRFNFRQQLLGMLHQPSGLGSVLTSVTMDTDLGQKISQEQQKAEEIQEEAQKRAQIIHKTIKKVRFFDERHHNYQKRIKDLKRQIADKEAVWDLNTERDLEDLRFELFELLENPSSFEPDEVAKNRDFSAELATSLAMPVHSRNKPHLSVPGMRFASPKKKDQDGSKGNSQQLPQQSRAPSSQNVAPVTSSTAISNSGMGPVTASISTPTVLVQVSSQAGSYAYPIPLEIHQTIVSLTEENRRLKEDNSKLKEEIQVIYKGGIEKLQTEVAFLEKNNKKLNLDITRLREDNTVFHLENKELKAEVSRLKEENAALYLENKQLRERVAVLEKELGALKLSHDKLKQDFDYHKYMLEVGQALGYVNDEIRRVFEDPSSPGFPTTQRMALRGELHQDESLIWADFARAHPGAENRVFAGIFLDIMGGRVGLAHPTHVNEMGIEEFKKRVSALKPNLNPEEVRGFAEFVYSFDVPENR